MFNTNIKKIVAALAAGLVIFVGYNFFSDDDTVTTDTVTTDTVTAIEQTESTITPAAETTNTETLEATEPAETIEAGE